MVYLEFASIVYHKNKCLIICVMLSDVNLHYLTLAARCPVSKCWLSCKMMFVVIYILKFEASVCHTASINPLYPATDCTATHISGVSGRW